MKDIDLFEGLYVKFLDKSELVRGFQEDTEKERLSNFRYYYFFPTDQRGSYPVLSKFFKLVKVVKLFKSLVEIETIESSVPTRRLITSMQFLELPLYDKYGDLYNQIRKNNINVINEKEALTNFLPATKIFDYYSYIEIKSLLQEHNEINKKLIRKINQLILDDQK